ncbi:hypothetical protein K503DRAFT_408836 [Rhizopogon vinicolor AM-OR11-026]|uniref:Uncharacterized protein n=1 Tax=Rhizopogon vinicolor AM-OR11-026 TaxID=1314800 RepID=A0A1B7NBE0_9AGAM|nr:hypothetical protein K503DRAFT_408836 [Rhizopogon vinicolor AM-OR11-026]
MDWQIEDKVRDVCIPVPRELAPGMTEVYEFVLARCQSISFVTIASLNLYSLRRGDVACTIWKWVQLKKYHKRILPQRVGGDTDNEDTDSVDTDNGDTDNEDTDTGDTDDGDADNDDTDTGDTDNRDTDNEDTDNEDTDNEDTDNEDTDTGDTDSGGTDIFPYLRCPLCDSELIHCTSCQVASCKLEECHGSSQPSLVHCVRHQKALCFPCLKEQGPNRWLEKCGECDSWCCTEGSSRQHPAHSSRTWQQVRTS